MNTQNDSTVKSKLVNAIKNNNRDSFERNFTVNNLASYPNVNKVMQTALEHDCGWAAKQFFKAGYNDIEQYATDAAKNGACSIVKEACDYSSKMAVALRYSFNQENYDCAQTIISNNGVGEVNFNNIENSLVDTINRHFLKEMTQSWVKKMIRMDSMFGGNKIESNIAKRCFEEWCSKLIKNNYYDRLQFIFENINSTVTKNIQNYMVESRNPENTADYLIGSNKNYLKSKPKIANLFLKHISKASAHTQKSLNRALYDGLTLGVQPNHIKRLIEKGADPEADLVQDPNSSKLIEAEHNADTFWGRAIKNYKNSSYSTVNILTVLKENGVNYEQYKSNITTANKADPLTLAAKNGTSAAFNYFMNYYDIDKSKYGKLIEPLLSNNKIQEAAKCIRNAPVSLQEKVSVYREEPYTVQQVDGLFNNKNTDAIKILAPCIAPKAKRLYLSDILKKEKYSLLSNIIKVDSFKGQAGPAAFQALTNLQAKPLTIITNTIEPEALFKQYISLSNSLDPRAIDHFLHKFEVELNENILANLLIESGKGRNNMDKTLKLARTLQNDHNINYEESGSKALAQAYEAGLTDLGDWLKAHGAPTHRYTARSL